MEHAKLGYDKGEVDVRKIAKATILSCVLITIFIVVLVEYFTIYTDEVLYDAVLDPQSEQLKQIQERDLGILNSYGIVDVEKGVYRIPIERAMELTAENQSK